MVLVNKMRIRVWGRPAVAYFVLSGMAAGFGSLWAFMTVPLSGEHGRYILSPHLKLMSPLMVVIGLLFLVHEAGRPLKGRFSLSNWRSSWMSREILVGSIFFSSSLLDYISPALILRLIVALSGVLFLLSQGLMLYRSKAILEWNRRSMPELFLFSGLAMGFGLYVILIAASSSSIGGRWVVAGFATIALDLVMWLVYLFPSRGEHLQIASNSLYGAIPSSVTIGIGHLLPLCLLVLLIPPSVFDETVSKALSWIVGICIIAGGIHQKAGIMLTAKYLIPITVKLPGSIRCADSDWTKKSNTDRVTALK